MGSVDGGIEMAVKITIVMADNVSYEIDKEFEEYRNAKGWFLKGIEHVAIENGKATANLIVVPVNGGNVMINPFKILAVEFEELAEK